MFQLLNWRDYCGHDAPGVPLPAGQAAAGRAGEVPAAGDQPAHHRHGALLGWDAGVREGRGGFIVSSELNVSLDEGKNG